MKSSPQTTLSYSGIDDAVLVDTPPAFRETSPTVRVTEAYNAWWWFAYERQSIYYRRLRGEPPPWTTDETLRCYRFTNAYRAADRVSQFLINNVIYADHLPQDANEVVFRILLFKLFNRIDTWEMLTTELGAVTLADDPFARIDELINEQLAAGRQVYSAAYIMPTSRSPRRTTRKHQAHLTLLQRMMADHLGDQLADTSSMGAGFELLRSYPMIGDFLAYQFITDINYSEVVDFSETEFVAAGPGAHEGLRKCFADAGGRTDTELIQMMMDVQAEEFERLGLDFPDLFGRPLQLIDCQNLFCEVAKYARVRFPALTPRGGRARIKRRYRYSEEEEIETPFFPPKWGINEHVHARFPASHVRPKTDLSDYQEQTSRTSVHEPVLGGDGITTPMLGLIGETGEVVSELKKRGREGAAYLGFRDRLTEELGDLLWYVADLARRRDICLAEVELAGRREGNAADARRGPGEWIRAALSLAENTGRISHAYRGLLADQYTEAAFNIVLRESLVSLMADLELLIGLNGLSLSDVANGNLDKVRHRWAQSDAGFVLADRVWPTTEQLPLRFEAWVSDHLGRVSVSFAVDGQTIPVMPDSLTDNAYDQDGYRYHDLFHLAYAAILDWSPVTRSLLRRKRKSDPRVDEVEDGGRAVAIEEGISAMVFAYATQHRMLQGVKTVEDSLLRTIRDMTRHLEVSNRTAAEWQDAIIQGFEIWRAVRDAGRGHIQVDRSERRIRLLGPGEPEPQCEVGTTSSAAGPLRPSAGFPIMTE